MKLQKTDDFDEQQAELKMKKLRSESNINALQLNAHVKDFLKRLESLHSC